MSSRLFQLSELGREVAATYSTNRDLFFDLMHFLFYSTWTVSPIWLVLDSGFMRASAMRFGMSRLGKWTALGLRIVSRSRVDPCSPKYQPSFSERAVRSVFPWLGSLTPSFLFKCGTKSRLCSTRRSHCTPQMFHLAVDLAYVSNGLRYGTAMAIDDERLVAICRTCLLDPDRFWTMAELTEMAIRGLAIRRGQWGTSIVLDGPPAWIDLPDFSVDQAVLPQDDEGGDDE